MIAVCGVKNSGKTTLITKLIPELRKRNLRIATIKHDGHDFEPDVPGTDSNRHRLSGAFGTAVFSQNRYMITLEKNGGTPGEMADFFPDADLILLEGCKESRYPKLEVIRKGNSCESVSEPDGLLAIVTDLPASKIIYKKEVPLLDLNNPGEIAEFLMSRMEYGSGNKREGTSGEPFNVPINEKTEAGTVEFTHFDQNGAAWMVDVGGKADTEREAVASGSIFMTRDCFNMVREGSMKKGDVLGVARVAGIMGAKRTQELIPLCHILNLTRLSIDFEMITESCEIRAICTAKTTGKTGVEMEALTGVSITLLTIYDMCKAVDKTMEIGKIALLKKSGGKSGEFINKKRG